MNIKNITHYETAFDLIQNEIGISVDEVGEEFYSFLRNFDAFESVSYFCINYDTVIIADSLNGETSGDPISIDDFIPSLRSVFEA